MGHRVLLLLMLFALISVGHAGTVAQGSTPTTAGECTVAPRSAEDLLALWYNPSGTPVVPQLDSLRVDEEADIPPGVPADAATIKAIDGVAREWVACSNAGDRLRRYALFTDELAQQEGLQSVPRDQARALLANHSPLQPEQAYGIGPPRQVRVLSDGRVGATFVLTQQDFGAQHLFIIFERQNGDWRLDEMFFYVAMDLRAPVWGYRVVEEYPHDPEAYTQGLVVSDGVLYEGTGQTGQSTLRRVELETGEVQQSRALDDEHFGEGIAVVEERIFQLTWVTETCFVYDRETFELLETFTYTGEGWGLTTDGERLVMSDGTNRLVFRDPATFAELGAIDVWDGDVPVLRLNELEYVNGEIWANVYTTDQIARIDPATGQVTGWIDLTGLLTEEEAARAEVLNGIAYDAAADRVFVTGKDWPKLFEIELVPPA